MYGSNRSHPAIRIEHQYAGKLHLIRRHASLKGGNFMASAIFHIFSCVCLSGASVR